MNITRNKLDSLMNTKSFKEWIFRKRWLENKSYLSDFDFSISLDHYEKITRKILFCIVKIQKGTYQQKYFTPFVVSSNLNEFISTNKDEAETLSNPHIFNLNSMDSKIREGLETKFFIEGEYNLRFWKFIMQSIKKESKRSKSSISFRRYSEKKLSEITSLIRGNYEEKTKKSFSTSSIAQIGHGNTTNILFKFTKALNKEKSKSNSYLFKFYKKYEKNIEPQILHILKKNNFRESPSLYGEFILENVALLCILDYIPNDGNIGSIFWFEINNFLEVLIKSYGKSKSNKNANFFKNKLNQCCARSRFIAKEIGYKIKGLHKALIEENMEKFRPKKIKKSKFLDDYTSVLENLIDQIVNHFKDKSKLYYEFLEKKHIIHLLKECRKKMLQICKRVDEKLIRIQRIHQDLHMEQILYKRKETMGSNSSELSYNYYFLDFEGDPQFSYKKKNSLFPVERDLASLSRSLSYIKFNAFKNNLHLINSQLDAEHKKLRKLYYLIFHSEALEEQKELQEIKFLLDGWEKKMQKNIITNYQIELDLFNFFTIERILRELAYEIKYRPKNIMIPIFGLKKTIA